MRNSGNMIRKLLGSLLPVLCIWLLPALPRLLHCSRKPLRQPLAEWRITDGFGGARQHGGIDLGAPEGTKIYAAAGGTVQLADSAPDYGNYIILQHENGLQTLYAHCAVLFCVQGDAVQCGECIALVGSTGDSTGPHLHFEVRQNGERRDPLLFTEIAPSR